MRIRTVRGAYAELKAADPQSAIGLTTLYRLVSEGVIPSTPLGKGKIMIDMDKLETYLFGKQDVNAQQRSPTHEA